MLALVVWALHGFNDVFSLRIPETDPMLVSNKSREEMQKKEEEKNEVEDDDATFKAPDKIDTHPTGNSLFISVF